MIELFKKIKYILNRKQINFAIFLLIMMFVGALLETFSIALIFPLVDMLTSSKASSSTENILYYIKLLGFDNFDNILNYLIFFIISIFVFKNFYLLFLSFQTIRFAANLHANVSNKLFGYYLKQDLTFHFNHHSSDLIRNIKGEIERFAALIKIVLNLLIELLVVLAIFVFLLIFSFKVTLIIFITLFIILFLYFFVFKKILLDWGKNRQKYDAKIYKLIQDGLSSIKELKILSREDEVIKTFKANIYILISFHKKLSFLNSLPKTLIEMLAVLFFCLFILINVNSGVEINNILSTIAVFAAVAFRLMPSFIRIINLMQQIRFELPVLDIIYKELSSLNKYDKKLSIIKKNKIDYNFKNSISFENISFKYPGTDNYVFENLSFTINKNDFFGILGQSGAGKSTIISILMGLLNPTSGNIKIDEMLLSGDLVNWYKLIGYVPQKIFLIDDSLIKNIAFGVPNEQINIKKVKECIKIAELEVFTNNLPDKIDTFIGEDGVRISGGQRQRIGLARALYTNPHIVVLDEATNEIDSVTESKIMHNLLLSNPKKTVILISHKKETISQCNNSININNFAL